MFLMLLSYRRQIWLRQPLPLPRTTPTKCRPILSLPTTMMVTPTIKVACWNAVSLRPSRSSDGRTYLALQPTLTNTVGKDSTIIMLQETRLKPSEERAAALSARHHSSVWSSHDPTPTPETPHPVAKHGVGILTLKGTDDDPIVSNLELKSTIPGRLIVATASIHGITTLLVNVYAPASGSDNDRIAFLDDALSLIEQHLYPPAADSEEAPALPMICCGDFNLCLSNRKTYLLAETPPPLSSAQLHLVNWVARLNLTETWNECNDADKVLYTWAPTGNAFGSPRRIDYVFTNNALPFLPVDFQAVPVSGSDHKLLKATLQHIHAQQQRPPAPFRLNARLLQDNKFAQEVLRRIDQLNEMLSGSPQECIEAWDVFKWRVVEYAASWSSFKAKRMNNKYREHLRLLAMVELRMQDPNLTQAELDTLQASHSGLIAEVQAADRERAEGARVRSHHLSCALTERCTKVFFSLEKECIKSQTIARLVLDDQEATTPADIAATLLKFYSKLYASEPVDQDAIRALLERANPARKLRHGEREALGAALLPLEILQAINNTAPDRSPGPDGLTGAFYQTFKHQLAKPLAVVANAAYALDNLPSSMKEGFLKVLFKKGDRSLPGNYRPITCLNVDSKIISRALMARFAKVSPEIVNLNQNGFVPNRLIDANIHLMRDILDYCKLTNTNGIAVLLDSEKAFDRVSHEFLFKALRAYGVGQKFIRWMKLLNTGCQSRVVYNCTISIPFPIQRSVRQGSVEAPFLYAIYAGVISDYVIYKLHNHMLKLPLRSNVNVTIEPSLFADDTTVFLSDPDDIPVLFETYELVGAATNLKINQAKTTFLPLGPLRHASAPASIPAGAEWVPADGTTRVLGIQLGYGDVAEANFTLLQTKVARALGRWAKHSLSVAGRTLIANAIGLSRVWYHCRFVIMPSKYRQKLISTIEKYLWNGRPPPVAEAHHSRSAKVNLLRIRPHPLKHEHPGVGSASAHQLRRPSQKPVEAGHKQAG